MKVKFNFLILLFVAAVTSCASGDALEVVSCGPYSSYGNDSWDPDSTDPNDRNPMVYYQDSGQVLEAFVSDPLAIGFHTDCVTHWLKEYNYKCPICREECGQAKYHI